MPEICHSIANVYFIVLGILRALWLLTFENKQKINICRHVHTNRGIQTNLTCHLLLFINKIMFWRRLNCNEGNDCIVCTCTCCVPIHMYICKKQAMGRRALLYQFVLFTFLFMLMRNHVTWFWIVYKRCRRRQRERRKREMVRWFSLVRESESSCCYE